MYILDPLRRYHRDSAQERAAAKLVLMFFRGIKISASWKRTTSVPASLNPSKL